MNTSLSGLSCGAASRQAWRAAATSGLSCSAACALFFEGHAVTVEKTPNRARRKRRPSLCFEHLGDLNQGHVRLGLDRPHDRIMMLFDVPGTLVAADPLGLGRSAFAPLLDKAHRARGRDPEPLRCRTARHPTLNRSDDPDPQILRQRLGHACWPPCPARSVNQNSRPLGIPLDSNRSDFALAHDPEKREAVFRRSAGLFAVIEPGEGDAGAAAIVVVLDQKPWADARSEEH